MYKPRNIYYAPAEIFNIQCTYNLAFFVPYTDQNPILNLKYQ